MIASMPPRWRRLAIFAWAQSIAGAMLPVHMILGGLVGQLLADEALLATLPISMMVAGSMLGAPAISALMARAGRRSGFLAAGATGVTGAFLAVHAIDQQSFALYCAASMMIGVYIAGQNLYRFAVAEGADPAFRARAIGLVLGGGLVAALVGPELVKTFGDALEPVPYAGAYAATGVVMLLGVLPFVLLAPVGTSAGPSEGRPAPAMPLMRAVARPRVAVAIFCGMVTYASMTLMMTSTPLAMLACGFATGASADVVRAHVLAMFAPSFVTGSIVARFGPEWVIAAGLFCVALAVGIGLSGIALANFYGALILLGLGWNLGFIGSTAMLAEAAPEGAGPRLEGANDFAMMALVLVASLGSGAMLNAFGWEAVQAAMLPMVTLAMAALAWLHLSRRNDSADAGPA
ncbi:MAG: MFS transporter [Pseudomonadota bacterium]